MGSSELVVHHARKSSLPKYRDSFELQTIHEDEVETPTELDKLKSVTKRLALATTRPSIVEWRANLDRGHKKFKGELHHHHYHHHHHHHAGKHKFLQNGNAGDDVKRCLECSQRTDDERKEELQRSIDWIKDELAVMRSQDHVLAMQLMRLRSEIQQFRLQRSISEHRELIENAAYNMEEELVEQKTALCDTPLNGAFLPGFDSALKDFGVTRMNLNARRFSLR